MLKREREKKSTAIWLPYYVLDFFFHSLLSTLLLPVLFISSSFKQPISLCLCRIIPKWSQILAISKYFFIYFQANPSPLSPLSNDLHLKINKLWLQQRNWIPSHVTLTEAVCWQELPAFHLTRLILSADHLFCSCFPRSGTWSTVLQQFIQCSYSYQRTNFLCKL